MEHRTQLLEGLSFEVRTTIVHVPTCGENGKGTALNPKPRRIRQEAADFDSERWVAAYLHDQNEGGSVT